MNKHAKWKKQTRQGPTSTPTAKSTGGNGMRWIVLGLALILAAAGSWAFAEFVVWNKVLWGELPGDLVGRWEVVEGPEVYKEGVFEFSRSGQMTGYLNQNGDLQKMDAQIRVEENKLYITTRQPSTGKEHVSIQIIQKLNAREFVVVDERGKVMKLVRMRDR